DPGDMVPRLEAGPVEWLGQKIFHAASVSSPERAGISFFAVRIRRHMSITSDMIVQKIQSCRVAGCVMLAE
ncbi:MAG: hypothetical protein ACFB0Z_06190, partial [Candidatus Phaeomarinobacter sp.]